MTLFQAFCFAFVQAATEFLPISSSGHLLFLKGIFGLEEIPILFDVIIHIGSLGAILFFFRYAIRNTVTLAVEDVKSKDYRGANFRMVLYVAISTIVTMIIFALFKDPIENALHHPSALKITYPIMTVILFSTFLTRKHQGSPVAKKNYLFPILLGLGQGLAIMPGISRSGTTISLSILTGVERKEATYYSFLLFIPAVLGALILQIMEIEDWLFFNENFAEIILAFLVSAIGGYLFLKFLTLIIKRNCFWMFGIYTLLMAVASFILF